MDRQLLRRVLLLLLRFVVRCEIFKRIAYNRLKRFKLRSKQKSVESSKNSEQLKKLCLRS